ncbi:MAG: 2OG-Fe(II) oxygenase [Planctomycetaceae bacterium]
MAKKQTESLTNTSPLLNALSATDSPGNFCVQGEIPLTDPGLEVDGHGPVKLPLSQAVAAKLISCCRQAPFGQGSRTIVDTDVRRVWELDLRQFQFTAPEWNAVLESILTDVQADLGLHNTKLNADLYKLLVYEKGSFFLPHRDTEKRDGMVATLVIGLPSKYTGGDLIVTHDRWKQTVIMRSARSGKGISYAAFYADCEHEIRPLKSGYRLCLVYNVSLASSRSSRPQKSLGAPSNAARTGTVAGLLHDEFRIRETYKLAIILQHRYTKGGLKRNALKGEDRDWADLLFAAAEQSGCVACLAQLTRFQEGMPSNWYELERQGRSHFVSGSWDEEKDGAYRGKATYEDLYEESLSLNGWSDSNGKALRFSKINLDNREVIADPPVTEWTPSREEYDGYTGNEGVTTKRWYHRAAIVVWPRDKQFSVLCDAGTESAISGLEQMTKQLQRGAKSTLPTRREQCVAFAEAIMASWKRVSRRRSWSLEPKETDGPAARAAFPAILIQIDDPGLYSRYLADVLTIDPEQQIDKSFLVSLKSHGWNHFEAALQAAMDSSSDETVIRNAGLLEMIAALRDKDATRLSVGRTMADHLVNRIVALEKAGNSGRHFLKKEVRSTLLVSLIKTCVSLSADDSLRTLAAHTLKSDEYDLTNCHIPAIEKLSAWLIKKVTSPDAGVSQWLQGCQSQLEQRTASRPEAPVDFRRPDPVTCTCRDCANLKAFLVNPDDEVAHFSIANSRRQHLQDIIRHDKCDIKVTTDRKTRPETLVCTKTTASYNEACKEFDRDSKNLSKITKLMRELP